MAEFGLTEAQEMLRQEVRRFAHRELAPTVRERMKLAEVPREIKQKIIDMGWSRLNVPAKYGGQQIDYVSLGIIVEELGRVDSSVSGLPSQNVLLTPELGNLPEEVQDEWFPFFLNFERIHCRGFTEAGAGSDIVALETKAVRDGDYYVISGEKQAVFGVAQCAF